MIILERIYLFKIYLKWKSYTRYTK